MTASINMNNSAAKTPVSPSILNVLSNPEQSITDHAARRDHACRLAAFAVAARSQGLPLRSLSFNLESLSDVIGDGHPPHVLLIASIAADMALNDNLSYTKLENGYTNETLCMLDDHWAHLVFAMMPGLWDLEDYDLVVFRRIKEAYIHAAGCLIAQNNPVLGALTSVLLNGLSLIGKEADIIVDAMMEVARVAIRSIV